MSEKKEVGVRGHTRHNPNNPNNPVSFVREHARKVDGAEPKDPSRSSRNTKDNRIGLQNVAEELSEINKPLDQYKLQIARMWLTDKYPFYARLLYRMPVVETRSMDTFAVDKFGRIYINPDYANALPPARYAAALAHELNHFIRGHHERFEPGTLGNLAGDCEINDDLKKAGDFDVDPNWIFPTESFGLPEDQTAEWYYKNIPQETHTCPDCKRQRTKYVFVGDEKVAQTDTKGRM